MLERERQRHTESRRSGRQVAASEPGFLTWMASDTVGVYLGGDNSRAVASRPFPAPGRKGTLLDGGRHVHERVAAAS